MLNMEWNAANTMEAFCKLSAYMGWEMSMARSNPTNPQTKLIKGRNKISAHVTPNTLMARCAKAARLAEVLAEDATILAVMVVPIFSPKTSMIP